MLLTEGFKVSLAGHRASSRFDHFGQKQCSPGQFVPWRSYQKHSIDPTVWLSHHIIHLQGKPVSSPVYKWLPGFISLNQGCDKRACASDKFQKANNGIWYSKHAIMFIRHIYIHKRKIAKLLLQMIAPEPNEHVKIECFMAQNTWLPTDFPRQRVWRLSPLNSRVRFHQNTRVPHCRAPCCSVPRSPGIALHPLSVKPLAGIFLKPSWWVAHSNVNRQDWFRHTKFRLGSTQFWLSAFTNFNHWAAGCSECPLGRL